MADEIDNSRSTYEQAKCCPKCGRPGEVRKIRVAQDLPWGTKIHEIYCVTELCIWFDTPWFVQVNADGSIPAPTSHIGEKKIYEGFEGHDEQAVHAMNQLHAMEQI